MIQALTPVFALFGVVAAAHLIAGLGIALGSRQAASLGIGLGAFEPSPGSSACSSPRPARATRPTASASR